MLIFDFVSQAHATWNAVLWRQLLIQNVLKGTHYTGKSNIGIPRYLLVVIIARRDYSEGDSQIHARKVNTPF